MLSEVMVVERTVTDEGSAVGRGVSGMGVSVGAGVDEGAGETSGEGNGDGNGEEVTAGGVCRRVSVSASRDRRVPSARTGTAPEEKPK